MLTIRRTIVGAVAAGTLVGLTACSGGQLRSTGITDSDGYKIGCPAVDAALGTGSVANKAAVAGLKGIRDQIDPSTDTRKFVDAAITVLQSGSAKDVPKDARTLVVNGCKQHGYTLQNLKK